MHSAYGVVSKDRNHASRVVRNLPEPGTVPVDQVMLCGGEVLVAAAAAAAGVSA